MDRYGVPFLQGTQRPSSNGVTRVNIDGRVERIFFLGMTESGNIREWSDPRDYSSRFFVGDALGRIRLEYADGSTQTFPLILGEGIWFGQAFYRYPDPFPTDARLRKALADAMHLYPPAPVEDGNYVAVIVPKPSPIRTITIESSPTKKCAVAIAGITVVPAGDSTIAGAVALPGGAPSPQFERFVKEKSLRPLGEDENEAQRRLNDFSRLFIQAMEISKDTWPQRSHPHIPDPMSPLRGISLQRFWRIPFATTSRTWRTRSTRTEPITLPPRVLCSGLGSERSGTNVGMYYGDSWSRDMGRSLEELTELGYAKDTMNCGDYCLRMARLWEEQPSLKIGGGFFPRHWSRIANKPDKAIPFENDGHALVTLFLYKLWQRLPNRNEWLRSRWADVKGAGDWILWQFDHPEISGANDGVLHTTGESAAWDGYSVYPDYACMEALEALAQMADSIGENQSAARWRDRAEKMRSAIADQYIVTDPSSVCNGDPQYGRVWTLKFAGWTDQSTVLGPLIFRADYQGFAPEDDDPSLHPVNEAAYQRLIDTYHRPFGFYGQASMGYGQGFVTQSALLLDRMHDATQMLDWIAKEIYDPRIGSYIVPEGVQIDPTGRFWYRNGDLGNGVQEAEIIKALRMVVGVDDTHPGRLQLFPRMPYDWNEIAVQKYPVLFELQGKMDTTFIRYKLERSSSWMKLEIASDRDLGPVTIRLGPFEKQPNASSVRVNGKLPVQPSVEHSGDSWWVRFAMPVGPVGGLIKQ